MKTRTKALVLTLCAALLVVTTVFATMAYLTANDKVENTFTVGKVAITLDEAKVDSMGSQITSGGQPVARVDENTYKLIPGHTYLKDPIVHVAAGSEDCYLFVKIDNQLKDILVSDDGYNSVDDQMKANGWAYFAEQDVWYYIGTGADADVDGKVVSAGTNVPVFSSIVVKPDVEANTLATYENKQIIVNAYAVQADGFESLPSTQAALAWGATFGKPAEATTTEAKVPAAE